MCKSLLLLLDDDETTFAFLAFARLCCLSQRWWRWWREDHAGASTWRGADMHARMDDVCKAFAM